MQADIQKAIWAGTVPLVISLCSDDLTDFVVPKPLHLTVPRVILWSSVITVVHSYFIKQTAQLDSTFYPYDNKFLLTSNAVLEACTNELDLAEIKSPVWLEGPGKTVIDWKVPVGVCTDLWASTAMNSNYVESPEALPIKIVAHFTKRPETLSDFHVVVCRGWSTSHKEKSKKDEDEKKNKNDKDSDLINKHAINTTKRALLEHNTRHLLPIFLQLPSATHIHACLSRIRMSSASLHNSPTQVMGLPTPTQSQFVSCLYSNSVSELSTTVPLCGCHDCTTFLTTLAGYDLHQNSSSVPSKAAKAVKMGVQKVLSALKRDSDSDVEDDAKMSYSQSHDLSSSSSSTIPPTMVTPGNDPQTSKALIHRSEMTKEQKEQWTILTTPAAMLLCQITRLIILSRTLCGTLSSFEKAADKLDIEVKDVWRRKVGRLDLELTSPSSPSSNSINSASNPPTPSNSQSFTTPISPTTTPAQPTFLHNTNIGMAVSVNDLLNESSLLYNKLIPKGWKPYYHYLPIKLYFTHHIGMLCIAPISKGFNSHLEKDSNGYSIKWTRNRFVSRIDSFATLISNNNFSNGPLEVDNSNSPERDSLLLSLSPFAPTNPKLDHPTIILQSLPPSIQELVTSPYCENLSVEQFMKVIFPNWKYKYGKPTAQPPTTQQPSSPSSQPTSTSLDAFTSDAENHSVEFSESLFHSQQRQQQEQQQLIEQNEKGPALVMVCHGIAIPYNTPLIWLYNHFLHPDLTLHITIALQEDVE